MGFQTVADKPGLLKAQHPEKQGRGFAYSLPQDTVSGTQKETSVDTRKLGETWFRTPYQDTTIRSWMSLSILVPGKELGPGKPSSSAGPRHSVRLVW